MNRQVLYSLTFPKASINNKASRDTIFVNLVLLNVRRLIIIFSDEFIFLLFSVDPHEYKIQTPSGGPCLRVWTHLYHHFLM